MHIKFTASEKRERGRRQCQAHRREVTPKLPPNPPIVQVNRTRTKPPTICLRRKAPKDRHHEIHSDNYFVRGLPIPSEAAADRSRIVSCSGRAFSRILMRLSRSVACATSAHWLCAITSMRSLACRRSPPPWATWYRATAMLDAAYSCGGLSVVCA